MDWLIYIMMIILFAAVLVLLWKNYRIKKEAKLFAEKVEDALDAIVTGKEWNMEEELEDSLWGRTGTQLVKAGHVFRKKEEDGFREKERVKGLFRIDFCLPYVFAEFPFQALTFLPCSALKNQFFPSAL